METPARNTRAQGGKIVRRRSKLGSRSASKLATRSTGGLPFWDGIVTSYGLTKAQLAETLGFRKDTLQKAARRDAAKTQARAAEMLEILHLLEPWAGGQLQALAWYRSQPIAALDGRTAEALVKSGRAAAVREYIDHIALGGFA
jgi:Protein of unknown function (DUF2384)